MNRTTQRVSGHIRRLAAPGLMLLTTLQAPCSASSDAEEVAFLDIPVGGRPAAMGGAYSALADDAYAPNLNPGGLGFLKSPQFSGQHLTFLESMRYEHLSFGAPLSAWPGASVGGAVQYLGSGEIAGSDADGLSEDGFSSRYAAYNLSFGRSVSDRLSLGITGKMITAKIDDVSARAFAADVGTMYRASPAVTLAAVVSNWGTKLTFLEEGDALPLALRLGMAWRPAERWNLSAEAVGRREGPGSLHLGAEWRAAGPLALRASYRTDGAEEAGALGGFTAGVGVEHGRYDFSYAWLPMGEFGDAHYFSVGMKFAPPSPKSKRRRYVR